MERWKIWIKHLDNNGSQTEAAVYPQDYAHNSSANRRARQLWGAHGENPKVCWIVSIENPFVRRHHEAFLLRTRSEAERVLVRLEDLVELYGFATVADACELIGLQPLYIDSKRGWEDLRKAEIVRDKSGYILKLPKALPIN